MKRRRLAPEKRLDRLRKKFERWRETKDGRERIPKEFWRDAIELAGDFSINKISKTLGINNMDLKKRVDTAAAPRRPGKAAKTAFVELGFLPPVIPSECVVELTRPGGATMKISLRGQKAESLRALSKAFLSQEE